MAVLHRPRLDSCHAATRLGLRAGRAHEYLVLSPAGTLLPGAGTNLRLHCENEMPIAQSFPSKLHDIKHRLGLQAEPMRSGCTLWGVMEQMKGSGGRWKLPMSSQALSASSQRLSETSDDVGVCVQCATTNNCACTARVAAPGTRLADQRGDHSAVLSGQALSADHSVIPVNEHENMGNKTSGSLIASFILRTPGCGKATALGPGDIYRLSN